MQSFFVLVMIGVAGLFLVPMLPIDHNIELRIVQSGSMEPNIMTGALIVVKPQEQYDIGDVIMFSSRHGKVPTTHRIVDINREGDSVSFTTKGDANEEADAEMVALRDVIGVVKLDVPRLGYILDFTRQPIGFAFLIVLPACLIILTEIQKIWHELRRKRQVVDMTDDDQPGSSNLTVADTMSVPISRRSHRMMDIATPVRYTRIPTLNLLDITQPLHTRRFTFTRGLGVVSILVFASLVGASSFLGHTVSYFYDGESSTQNTLQAIGLDFVAASDEQALQFAAGGAVGGDGSVQFTVVPQPDSAAMHYDVSAAMVGGGAVLCDALSVTAAPPASYSGMATLLNVTDVTFTDPWPLAFSLSTEDGLLGGETCTIALTFTAWHSDETNTGYFDEEVISLDFSYLPTVLLQATAPALAKIVVVSNDENGGEEKPADVTDSDGGSGGGGDEIAVHEAEDNTPETDTDESTSEKKETEQSEDADETETKNSDQDTETDMSADSEESDVSSVDAEDAVVEEEVAEELEEVKDQESAVFEEPEASTEEEASEEEDSEKSQEETAEEENGADNEGEIETVEE